MTPLRGAASNLEVLSFSALFLSACSACSALIVVIYRRTMKYCSTSIRLNPAWLTIGAMNERRRK